MLLVIVAVVHCTFLPLVVKCVLSTRWSRLLPTSS